MSQPNDDTNTPTNPDNHRQHGDMSTTPHRYFRATPGPALQPEDPRESSDFVSPTTPTRMLIRYAGSKWRLPPRIIALIEQIAPKATTYTEAYAGALAVYWRKPPHPTEAINDLDHHLTTTYAILADPIACNQLQHRLANTPITPKHFRLAHLITQERIPATPLDIAWATITFYNLAFRTKISTPTYQCDRRIHLPQDLLPYHHRLRHTHIDSTDALAFLQHWDGARTIHFVDPPYPTSVKDIYRHQFSERHYQRLITLLTRLRGAVILTTYDHPALAKLQKAGYAHESRTLTSTLRGDQTVIRRTEHIYYRPAK
jgi:DNA adenine methylase